MPNKILNRQERLATFQSVVDNLPNMTAKELMIKFEAELSKVYAGKLKIDHMQTIGHITQERVAINRRVYLTWNHLKENHLMESVQKIAELLKANELRLINLNDN